LDRFAERLIRLVRDRAIIACDQLISGEASGPLADRWREIASTDDARESIEALIPDIVEQTLFQLCDALDNGQLPLGWRRDDGSCVPLEELGQGEMAGWIMMGAGGWVARFSQERFTDAFANLDLEQDWDDRSVDD
jgi:hypothetical protein